MCRQDRQPDGVTVYVHMYINCNTRKSPPSSLRLRSAKQGARRKTPVVSLSNPSTRTILKLNVVCASRLRRGFGGQARTPNSFREKCILGYTVLTSGRDCETIRPLNITFVSSILEDTPRIFSLRES